ncbi:MAG: cell division protein ZapB [Spirochaetaceae bacterium]|jgi:chromosome segregation ATPase|nr:cell division protein ZapB [Spirochaetaceae bacterium]
MVTLEQVKLLETKVAKTIDFVNRITEENTFLKGKLDDYQKRIDELEVLIQSFKNDQGRIEDGILSALDRLSQFEAAMERSIFPEKTAESAAEAEAGESGAEPDQEPEPVISQSEPEAFPGKLFVEDEGEESDEEILFAAGGEGERAGPEAGESVPPVVPAESVELDIF